MSRWNRPPLGPNTISSLWPFQGDAVEAIFGEWNAGRYGTMAVVCTGGGKTRIASNVARRIAEGGGNTLFLAHTKELVLQASNWLHRAGMATGVEMGQMEARANFDPQAVAASVQTMQGDRLLSWPKHYFDLVIIDELHHFTDDSWYRFVIDHLDPALLLGLTATPKRHDKKGISGEFKSIAYTYSLLDAVKAPPPGPYLVRPLYWLVDLGINLGSLAKKQSDYTDEHLQERILPHVKEIARATVATRGDRPTVVFVPSVMCAQGVATALQSLGAKADWVSGEREGRPDILGRYASGELDILVNVAVLTEGWDDPKTSCIVMARPTKAWSLLVQMLGRGMRRHDESGKRDCLMIDLGFITPEHDLLTLPVDLFDDHRQPAEVMREAREIVRSKAANGDRAIDLADAIEEAEQTVKKKAEWQVKATTAGKDLKVIKLDPVREYGLMLDLPRQPRSASTSAATEGQVRVLEGMGLEGVKGLSKAQASQYIDQSMRRKDKGLCTFKQFRHLRKAGVPVPEARSMTFHEASAYLNTLWGKK
jgi:superfamily II DNA or RNA helicase